MLQKNSDELAPAPGRRARMIIDAIAGAISGCISRIAVGPLDVIKIRFQVQLEPLTASKASKYTGIRQALTTVFKEEGIQGLWRGTVPGLLMTVPYTAVQFVALQQCKEAAAVLGLTSSEIKSSSLVSFSSGAIAGAAATVASYPFDLLRTTLAAQGEPKVYCNMFEAGQGIIKQHGLIGLYRGLGVTLVEIMPYAALQFGLYDMFTEAWQESRHSRKGTSLEGPRVDGLAHFSAGLLAGLFAKLASHPLDVVKKRYQVAGLQRSLSYGARIETDFALQRLHEGLHGILRTEGFAGLWKGSGPSILKAGPAAAITFTAYEIVLALLLKPTNPLLTADLELCKKQE
ncbi:hypothetical protein CEUSTIGMA_g162.t1 [Chlamydomonas eustigma]|uniref:Uncharacterized protein n=1 Tax=Chlamydomonas eustigma TaxID=1157962 RepID=A0A250WPT1_9CHLO|nr:hypothetical protein CEUSTIGMA_g162.t1 [Chlamydomonas eustigma]|eukprot:GAX72706.1 hypothetical protein CEUSTIGMA_g162.t1 [Chlamydomonas eustigma]